MELTLVILGSFLGLAATGAAFYTAWMVRQLWKQQGKEKTMSPADTAGQFFLKWTVLDYAVIGLFVVGMLLLCVDLLAVIRDHKSFPMYHYGYLLCGIVFSFLGMLFLFVRLAVVIRMSGLNRSFSPDHQNKPDHADHPEQGI